MITVWERLRFGPTTTVCTLQIVYMRRLAKARRACDKESDTRDRRHGEKRNGFTGDGVMTAPLDTAEVTNYHHTLPRRIWATDPGD